MEMKFCKTDEEISQAMLHTSDQPSSEELDEMAEKFEDTYENPVVVTLANYLDAVYALVEDECGDWSEYIDFNRYMKDLIQNEENLFSLVKIPSGYCLAYEDMPEYDGDDEDDEEIDEIDVIDV